MRSRALGTHDVRFRQTRIGLCVQSVRREQGIAMEVVNRRFSRWWIRPYAKTVYGLPRIGTLCASARRVRGGLMYGMRQRASRGPTRAIRWTLAALALALSGGCKPEPSKSTGSVTAKTGGAVVANGEVDLPADDGQWVRPAKDFASTRFSGLTEITTSNVKNLRTIATFSTG